MFFDCFCFISIKELLKTFLGVNFFDSLDKDAFRELSKFKLIIFLLTGNWGGRILITFVIFIFLTIFSLPNVFVVSCLLSPLEYSLIYLLSNWTLGFSSSILLISFSILSFWTCSFEFLILLKSVSWYSNFLSFSYLIFKSMFSLECILLSEKGLGICSTLSTKFWKLITFYFVALFFIKVSGLSQGVVFGL